MSFCVKSIHRLAELGFSYLWVYQPASARFSLLRFELGFGYRVAGKDLSGFALRIGRLLSLSSPHPCLVPRRELSPVTPADQ